MAARRQGCRAPRKLECQEFQRVPDASLEVAKKWPERLCKTATAGSRGLSLGEHEGWDGMPRIKLA